MTLTVLLATVLWVIVVPIIFFQLPRRKAIIACLAAGWMFLPINSISFPGIPDIDKTALTCVPIFLLCFALPGKGWKWPKFDIQDVLMLLFCITPFFSSMSNGLGLYDGIAATLNRLPMWMYPYLLGRFYFNNTQAVRTLCWGLFIAGIVYVPFCLWEIRMSPQFHKIVYGFAQKEFMQSVRGSTYRPMVFMNTGLTVGMWMMMASYIGWQMLRSRNMPIIKTLPAVLQPRLLLFGLIGVFILCKSYGAVILFLVACLLFELARMRRSKAILMVLIFLPVIGVLVKTNSPRLGVEQEAVTFFEKVSTERAGSLQFRIDNETLLLEKALRKPTFGWGGWGGAFIYNEAGEKTSVVDGWWIILLGANGILGLALFYAILFLPAYRYARNFSKKDWDDPGAQLTLAVMAILPCYGIDALINDMQTPIYMLVAGTVTSLITASKVTETEKEKEEHLAPVGPVPAFRYL